MPIECLQRVLKRLGILAELPDGTGEVLGACDEVAPRSIQGHARYHSCKQQKVEEGGGGTDVKNASTPRDHPHKIDCQLSDYRAFRGCTSTYTTPHMPI